MPAIPAATPRKRTESTVQDEIRLALGRDPRCAFWRNNCGSAQETATDGSTRWVAYGVGAPGGADLIGMIGGRFAALEVKSATGRVRPEQAQWLALVRARGGFACVVRSADEARAAVTRCVTGASE